MRRRFEVTLAIPVAILLLGFVIPAVVNCAGGSGKQAVPSEQLRYGGRTASEWLRLAESALAHGHYGKAIAFLKSAERVEPGTQYAAELRAARRARWRAREIARAKERFLGNVEHVVHGPDGQVRAAYRVTEVLPGESLWSLARASVAAERGVLPAEVPSHDPDVYERWDRLTDINGVRGLRVGERVKLPVSTIETASVAIEGGLPR